MNCVRVVNRSRSLKRTLMTAATKPSAHSTREKQKGPATLSAEPPWITPGKIELQGKATLEPRG